MASETTTTTDHDEIRRWVVADVSILPAGSPGTDRAPTVLTRKVQASRVSDKNSKPGDVGPAENLERPAGGRRSLERWNAFAPDPERVWSQG